MEFLSPGLGLITWQLIGLLTIVLYIVAVFDIIRSQFQNNTHQLLWLVIVLIAPFLGAFAYFFLGGRYKLR